MNILFLHTPANLRSFLIAFVLVFTLLGLALPTHAETTLAKQIEQYMQQQATDKNAHKITAEDKSIMQQAAIDLAKAKPDPGLKAGESAPDFSLPNAYGKQIKLSSLLKKGPVIINFYRGAWCPFCNLELHALKTHLPHFKKYGATLISITPQKPGKSLQQLKKDKFPFDILSDLDSSVIKQYKLFFTLSPKLVTLYKKFGINLEDFNGKGRNELPVPGTFVIDKKGIIRAAFANTDYTKRMEPRAIIDALKGL